MQGRQDTAPLPRPAYAAFSRAGATGERSGAARPQGEGAERPAGVTALDEMARWSRADARRISGLGGVSKEVIMHQWIFETQSVLFEQYQAMMTQGA